MQGFTPPVGSQFYFTSTLKRLGGYNEKVLTCVDHDLWLTLSVNGIYLKSLSKSLTLPNDDVTLERMTTNREKRLTRMANSFLLWKPDIVSFYGINFYEEFVDAYYTREKKLFLNKVLVREGLLAGLSYYKENSILFSSKDLVKAISKFTIMKFGLEKRFKKNSTRKSTPSLAIKNSYNNV